MEFNAVFTNNISADADVATASVEALYDALQSTDKVLKGFQGNTSAAAAGLSGAMASAVKNGASSVDKYAEALSRMRGRLDTAKEAFKNNSAVKSAADAFDHLKEKTSALKDKLGAGLASAFAPMTSKLAAAKEKAGALLDKVKDTKGFKFLADAATLTGGAASKGFASAKEKAGAFLEKIKDSKGYQAGAEGLKKLGGGLSTVAAGAGKAGIAIAAIAVGASLAGIKMGLPLALGYKGMAKMQMISAKLSLDVRKLFSGVDPGPVLKAAEKFATLFSKTTSTGRVLSDVVGRIFNGLFGFLSAAEPYAEAFFQGLIYGFLTVENAYLKVRIQAIPFIGSLSQMVGKGQLMKVVFYGAAVVMGLMAVAVAGALAPFVALAAGIEKVIGLYNEWTGNTVTLKKAPKAGGTGGASSWDTAGGKDAGPSKDAAGLAGTAAGMAMGDGLVKGIEAKLGAATAAGAALGKAADTGVKTAAEIKSPSRKMRRSGGYMGQGLILGMKDSEDGVQKAAANSLVPDLGKSPVGAPKAAKATEKGSGVTINFNGPVGGSVADFEAAARRAFTSEVQDALMNLGI